jgi:ferric-dicitrate binding protein FerR (iron transport regulator)
MNIGIRASAWATALTLSFLWASAWAASGGVFQEVTGEVRVGSVSVKKGDAFASGATIYTGASSRAILRFKDGQRMALASNAEFKVEEYSYFPAETGKSRSFFSLIRGGLRAITGLMAKREPASFRLKTQVSTIGIRGTDFITITNGGDTYLVVTEGPVLVTLNTGEVITVEAGSTILIRADGSVVYGPTIPPDVQAIIDELTATDLGGAPLPVAGAAALPSDSGGVPPWIIGVGAGLAGVAAAAGGGGSNSTPTHQPQQ